MEEKQYEGIKLLRNIKSMNHMIEMLQMEIDKIYTRLTSTTSKQKEVNVQSSGDPDPMSTMMAQVIEYEDQIKEYQAELSAKSAIAMNVIKKMDIENQDIIMMRYFRGMTVEDIAKEIHYSYRWAWEKIAAADVEFVELYEKTT